MPAENPAPAPLLHVPSDDDVGQAGGNKRERERLAAAERSRWAAEPDGAKVASRAGEQPLVRVR